MTTTTRRFAVAVSPAGEATTPTTIAHYISEACDEIADEPVFNNTNAMRSDQAVRLWAYRLAKACDVLNIDQGEVDRLVDFCESRKIGP